jgi:GH25 family lysozyme M1 (1,4-beta-N-acetylmuramidase)
MSKLGAHTTGTPRNGYGAFCQAKPAVVLAANDGGALTEAKAVSQGHTVTIFRDTTVYLEGPGDLARPPVTFTNMAGFWYPRLKAKWRQNPADYYTLTNTRFGNDLRAIRNLVAYERELMKLANADGFKVCVLNLASDSPGDLEVWKRECAPFIAEAWAAGNIYGRDAYGGGDLVDSTGQALRGGPRRPLEELEWLNLQGQRGGLVLTEAGLDGGLGFPGIERFVSQMTAYEKLLRAREDLIGMCMWNLGPWSAGSANWQDAIPRLIGYMEANPSPAWAPPRAEAPPAAPTPAPVEVPPDKPIGTVIDVSRWNGNINWDLFRDRGVELAFIRASSGPGSPVRGSGPDTLFDRNVAECNRVGVIWGPYHFLYPGAVAEQVALFSAQYERLGGTAGLPPVLDVELSSLTVDQVKEFVDGWSARFPEQRLMIYTNMATWNMLRNPAWSAELDLWVAHWTSAKQYIEPSPGRRPAVPKPWTQWSFWQWTSHGQIPGHRGRIDFNYFNGDRRALNTYLVSKKFGPPDGLPEEPGGQLELSAYFSGGLEAPRGVEEAGPMVEVRLMEGEATTARRQRQLQVGPADARGNVPYYYLVYTAGWPAAQWQAWRINPQVGTIQRGRDTSHSARTFTELRDTPGQPWSNWCPIKLRVGESYRRLVGELVHFDKKGCRQIRLERDVASYLKLVGHFPRWTPPESELELNEVVQLRWSQQENGPSLEDYFLSADPRAPGMVGWQAANGRSWWLSALPGPEEQARLVREALDCD